MKESLHVIVWFITYTLSLRFQEYLTRLNSLSFYTMGNQKNVRKRKPTAKKLAENDMGSDSPPSHLTSTRPKPRPTGKAAIKDPKPSVTWADSDTSMIDSNAGEDETIEEDEDDDGTWNDDNEEFEEVTEVKRKETAPLAAGMLFNASHKTRRKLT